MTAPTSPPAPTTAAVLRARVRGVLGRTMALQLPDRAAALAYYAFLAVPALVLLGLGVLGLALSRTQVDDLVGRLNGVMPADAVTLLQDAVHRSLHGGNGLRLLLVSVPLALWSATGFMGALMRALNAIEGTDETRGRVRQRLVALGMLAFTLLALVLVVGVLVVGPQIAARLGSAATWVYWVLQWPVLVAGVMLAFTGIMRLGPDVEGHISRRATVVGGVVATMAWLVISGLFSLYVNRLGAYDTTWGQVAIVVVTLTWMWLSSIALLVGALVSREIEHGTFRAPGRSPGAPPY
ncbi:MAG: YihY/virulence factor BrkB family protein [Thermoleophilia bacterium]